MIVSGFILVSVLLIATLRYLLDDTKNSRGAVITLFVMELISLMTVIIIWVSK